MDTSNFSTISVKDLENHVQFSLLARRLANLCLLLEKSPMHSYSHTCCYGVRELVSFSLGISLCFRSNASQFAGPQRDGVNAQEGLAPELSF